MRSDATGSTLNDECANAIDASLTSLAKSTGALLAQDVDGENSYTTAAEFFYGGRLTTHNSLKAPFGPVHRNKFRMPGRNDTHSPLTRPHDDVMADTSNYRLCLARMPVGQDATTWVPTSGSDFVFYRNIIAHM